METTRPYQNGTRGFKRWMPVVARFLMGFIFTVAGLNGFLNFLPQPAKALPEGAMTFAGAMVQTGYLLQLAMGTQLATGLLLLCNRWVPLALAVIAPVIVNIVAFHMFLAPSGLPPALVVLVLEVYLAWIYRENYLPMLVWRAKR
jgi:hypothetical protein